MSRYGPIAVVDLGTSKVVCFIALPQSDGSWHIAGIGHQVAEGIQGGIVTDIKKAETSILSAVHLAEKMAEQTIDAVFVSFSGASITSHTIHINTQVSGHEVTDRDINHIIAKGYEHFNAPDATVLHCVPLGYTLDDMQGVHDPRGMYGKMLATTLHIVTVSATVLRNITSCLAQCHLDMEDAAFSGYMSGLVSLSQDEMQLGVLLVDIGASSTSLAVFSKGHLVHTDTVPLGGEHITHDIAYGLSVSVQAAERIKTLYGNVIHTEADNQENIELPAEDLGLDVGSEEMPYPGLQRAGEHVSKARLCAIIRPRAEEILEMVKQKLQQGGPYAMAGNRLVLSGGTSQLRGMQELASQMFHCHTRAGLPKTAEGLAEATRGPSFATAIGLLHYAEQKRQMEAGSLFETETLARKSMANRMVQWFKQNF